MPSQGVRQRQERPWANACMAQMNKSEGLPFKSYSNQLVANLEDADAGVRDTAKKAVVDLFG